MPTDKPRITITVTEQEMNKINEYRFNNRMKNQTQAIVSLIEKGLDVLNCEDESKFESDTKNISSDDLFLLERLNTLNQKGKSKVIEYIDDLIMSGQYKKSTLHEVDKMQA